MAAHQAPLSLGFSRQEHWSGLSLPSPTEKVKSESEVAQLCQTCSNPTDCSPPGSSVRGISRQKYWSGVPLPSPESRVGPGFCHDRWGHRQGNRWSLGHSWTDCLWGNRRKELERWQLRRVGRETVSHRSWALRSSVGLPSTQWRALTTCCCQDLIGGTAGLYWVSVLF